MQHFDIYICGYPVQDVDIQSRMSRFDLRISRFDLGYLYAINHSSAASHRSIAWTGQNRCYLRQGVRYCLVWQVVQVWAPLAPAQKRRAPTIEAALRPTGSGAVPTRGMRLLSIRRGGGRQGAATTLSWSSDGGSTGKKTNISGVPAREPKSVYLEHRTREWGQSIL